MDKETRKWAKKKKVLGLHQKTRKQRLYEQREELVKKLIEVNGKINHGKAYTLDEALNKVWNVKPSIKGNYHIGGVLKLPLCLIDKNVKLRIAKLKLSQ